MQDPKVTAANAERQAKETHERRELEAAERPDPMHRAVKFLLEQATLNNHDVHQEAEYLLQSIDEDALGDPEANPQHRPRKRVRKPPAKSHAPAAD